MFLSKIPVLIIYFIQKFQTKNSRSVNNLKDLGSSFNINGSIIYIKKETFWHKMKLIIIIIALCFLDFGTCVISSAVRETEFPFFNLDLKALLFFFTATLSAMTLNYKYHWHHFFGVLTILIGIFIYTGNDIGFRYESISAFSHNLPDFFLYMLVVQIFVSIQECSEKYLMEIQYISPYLLISMEGIIGTIIVSFSFFILNYIPCSSDSFFCNPGSSTNQSIEQFISPVGYISRHYEILVILIFVYFSYMLFGVFRVLTNQHFSPYHRAIADTYGSFLEWIIVIIFSLTNTLRQKINIGFILKRERI